MEKVVIACCGQCLEDSGDDLILKECEMFDSGFVKHVLSGSHYV